MRSLACTLLCAISLAATASAQQRNKTEAHQDGLAGPVKSVTTLRQTSATVRWQQPSGPGLVIPLWCRVCEYDPDGYRTRSGDVVDGKFIGESITLTRDGGGNVIARRAVNATTGDVFREERFGPYGRVEGDYWNSGKHISHQVFRYDEIGNQSEWLTRDGSGNSTGRVVTVSAKDGTVLSRSSWAGDGTLLWRTAYDPAGGDDEIQVNEKSGAPALRRVADNNGKPSSFWEASEDSNRFGQKYTVDRGNGDVELHECHRASGCSVSLVHYVYAGPGKLNPTSAEWRDEEGTLQYAAYYEYDFDSARNWTHRKIWVVSAEQSQRTLYEEDWRTITYWDN